VRFGFDREGFRGHCGALLGACRGGVHRRRTHSVCSHGRRNTSNSLPPELEQLVQTNVQSGRYNSASEVVREALRLLEQRDEIRSIQLQELRGRMDRALGEAARGEGSDGEAFMQEMLEELDAKDRP